MNTEHNHIVYTAQDIQRYLSGGMSNAEMHAMEKAALDDPLLSEAIEGYDAVDEQDWTGELAQLKEQLAAVENAPVVPVYKNNFARYWKAAAAVLVIATSVTTAYIFTRSNPQRAATIASKNEPASASVNGLDSLGIRPDSMPTTSIAANGTITSSSSNITLTDERISNVETKQYKPLLDSVANNDFVYTPSAKVAEPVFEDLALNEGRNSKVEKESTVATNERTAPAAGNNPWANNSSTNYNQRSSSNEHEMDAKKTHSFNESENSDLINNTIVAQVITPDNKPVPQANVSIAQFKKPVYTDANGNFAVNAKDTAVDVVITAAGYNTSRKRLSSNLQNKVVLQPADNAQQIKIGSKKAKATITKPIPEVAEGMDEEEDMTPTGGWVEYNNYLDNNRVLPNSARQQNIHGEVEVIVKLKNNGEIAKVKVEKTLCPECDAEAVRLVTEGPKWEVKTNKAGKAKVKVKF